MKKDRFLMIIGGEQCVAESDEYFDILNPGTEEKIAQVPLGDRIDAKKAIDEAQNEYNRGTWSEKTPSERAAVLSRAADILEQNAKELAILESTNQGKTIKLARDSDIPFAIDNLRFFAGAARTMSGSPSSEYANTGTSILRREPIGVVACIVPWNYPLMIAVWKIAPALAAGNTVVLKPASYTPLTAIKMTRIMLKAGLPKGALNVVTGPGHTVGEELVENSKVDMVSMTGDTETGKQIMSRASKTVKKVHLELGGKAPFIVLKDADIDAATEAAVVGGFVNSGQDCTAATRLYIHEDIHKQFVEKLILKTRKMKTGYQLDPESDMGPLVSKAQLERVKNFIKSGLEQGAKLLIGGRTPYDKGFFLEPTIFDGVLQEMDICQKEIFGPVLSALSFKSNEEVIEKANDVVYGLASSVWTRDLRSAMVLAKKLRFGEVWVNDHLPLFSEMPHGGYKMSGSGMDLSIYSLEDHTHLKHVYIDTTGEVRKPFYYTVFGKKDR